MAKLRTQGMMIILSSPSGAGKSSLSKALVNQDGNLYLSVSATTRPARPGEIDGIDYHFLSKEQFDKSASDGVFLESAEVFGYNYGTIKTEVERRLYSGIDVMFDIDWQGAREISSRSSGNVVSIYILPPSLDVLKQRLTKRCQDDTATINKRMDRATEEISHYDEYDYVIINDDFEDALQKLQSIINAERCRRTRMDLISGFAQSF